MEMEEFFVWFFGDFWEGEAGIEVRSGVDAGRVVRLVFDEEVV